MIKTKKYRLYNIQVRDNDSLLVYPIGANSEEEAIGILIGKGIKRAYIIGEEK